MNPYHDHTIIHIDIQAPNKLEILTCVRETFDYMPGWLLCSSVHASLTDARFYCFNLTMHTFEWWRANDSYADTMDEDDVVIKDLADISHLLEFVWLNGEALRGQHFVVDPPKKRKEADGPSLAKMKAKMKIMAESLYHPSTPVFIQPMDMPTGNVFYKDLNYPSYYGGKSKLYGASAAVKTNTFPYWEYDMAAVDKKAKEYAQSCKQAQEEAYKKWQWGWDGMPHSMPHSSPHDKPIKAGYDY